jgi:hypothetical protein
MRGLHISIAFSLFIGGVACFAEEPKQTRDCAELVPDDENFIISGTLLRNTIHCLEDLIETKHQQHAVIKTEATTTKKGELKADTLSTVSIQLTNKANQKTVAAISFVDHQQKKTIELPLN